MKFKNIIFLTILTLFLTGCGTSASVTEADNLTINNYITNVDASNVDVSRSSLVTSTLWDKCSGGEFGDECYVVQKFGHSDSIGTSITPIAEGLMYQTPTSASSLEIVSSSTSDTFLGTGARTVMIYGLNSTGHEVRETISMNGTTAVSLSTQYLRVYRMHLMTSGTYANQSAGSHAGTITLRGTGGGVSWAVIALNTFPLGQTEIGIFSTPKGYTSYLGNFFISVEGQKDASIYFFSRGGINNTVAPFDPMRILLQIKGVSESELLIPKSILGGFPELTDLGFMAYTSTGTTGVSVNFEILLLKDSVYGG